ncbi:TPA: hypothetical protein DIC38_01305 [Candidatus Nomurabacteria bacterium]|nr:MAG: hypothetical protein O210_OD1C00001G0471 [Parcubacteria bacterium RAAC4_OD1_1]HCY26303.1 hypothetical protein [Candidatus Nomurabacteria bacterium]
MDNSFQTSFIPKKPVVDVIKRNHKIDLFTIISILILIFTIIVSAGVYLYKIYLVKQKEALYLSLDKSRNSFEEQTIRDLEAFDKRVSASKDLLSKHKVLTPLFGAIAEITIPNVQYTEFNHNNLDGQFFVEISGVATDYKTIAQQSEIFNSPKGRYFSNVVFFDLVKNNIDNTVDFKLNFVVDPSLLSYEINLLAPSENLNTN